MGKAPADPDALLLRIDDLVRAHGAIPRAELRAIKRHLPAIAPRLLARGYEIGSSVRLPLEKQLLELVQSGFVPRKGLERRVAGATAREVNDAVQRLVERGSLVEVVRESGAGLVGSTGDVIDASDVEELLRCLVKVEKLARRALAAKRARATLLRSDVAGPLVRWTDRDRVAAPGVRQEAPLVEALTREIRKRFRENPLPIRVPDLLRSMGASGEDGKRALVDGAERGLFELEPESGMGRLSREDAELCPSGPMGTTLSWVVARDREEFH